MIYKLLAPFKTDFSLFSDVPIRQPETYTKFWERVQQNKAKLKARLGTDCLKKWGFSEELEEIKFYHADFNWITKSYNRYQLLDQDSLARTLQVIEIRINPGKQLPANQADIEFACSLKQLSVKVFDFEVSLLEADFQLDVDEQFIEKLDETQKNGIKIGSLLAEELNQLLQIIFKWIRSNRKEDDLKIIEDESAKTITSSGYGQVLWVTRSLIFEPEDQVNQELVIKHWLKNSNIAKPGKDGAPSFLNQILKDPALHSTHWLNYLFREKSYDRPLISNPDAGWDGNYFCDAWEAMVYCQYYYSALEIVDLNLTRIMATSFSKSGNIKVNALKNQLEKYLRDANLLLAQFHDNQKYYKRSVKKFMDDIMDNWSFETVLIAPVENKVKVCQERLNQLHSKETERASKYSDLILGVISIASILSIFIALADYGRSMSTDSNLASYDLNTWNVIEWYAGQPTDLILSVSLSFSLLLIVAYLFFRNGHKI